MARLVQLATAIFDTVCQDAPSHPARSFQAIVHNAASLIVTDEHEAPLEFMDDLTLHSLATLMDQPGFEWPGNLFDMGTEFPVDANNDLTADINS